MASAPVIAIGKPILKTYRKYAAYKAKFDDWRAVRPFWGGTLLIFAGLLLAYIPFITLDNFAFTGGTGELIGLIGLVFAFFVFLSGVAAITHPRVSTLAGMTGIVMSILSVVGGTFGGMGVGTFVGMVGGSLCVAWIQEEETVELDPDAEDQDMEELRKKAQQYEQMVSEGEIDEDDDVSVQDLTLDEEGEVEGIDEGTDEPAEAESAGADTEEADEAETRAETGAETVEDDVTDHGIEDLTDEDDGTDASGGKSAEEDEEDEDWIP